MKGLVLFISGQEFFFLFLIALLLFGSRKIPEMARGLGKGLREFRKATDDIKREINESTPELKKDFDDIKKDINKSADDVTKDFNKLSKDIE